MLNRSLVFIIGFLFSTILFANPPTTTVNVNNTVLRDNVKRIGINMGALDHFSSALYLNNIILNPGFEDGEVRQLVPAINITTTSFQEAFWHTGWNTESIGKPVGFWNGASFEIYSGPQKGFRGTITNHTHEEDRKPNVTDGRHTFYIDPPLPTSLNDFTIIAVAQHQNIEDYYPPEAINNDRRHTYTTDVRPGSEGKKSLFIYGRPSGNTWQPVWTHYFDSFGRDSDRNADKLLVFKGEWKVNFWAKSDTPNTSFRARLSRASGETLLTNTFTVGTSWQEFTYVYNIPEGTDVYPTVNKLTNPPQPAAFNFYIDTPNANVKVDDLFFGTNTKTNPTNFEDVVVNKLKELKPGVIRFWGTQLGSGLYTQIESPFVRGTYGSNPRYIYGGGYNYSLHEFLTLCKEVGAEPWYVVPPKLSQEELLGLIDYLCAPQGQHHSSERAVNIRISQGQIEPWVNEFTKIHLEYGNEMWGGGYGGDPFYGSSAVGGPRLGEISHFRFGIMKSHPLFNSSKISLTIGGQAGWPPTNYDIMIGSQNSNALAIAPYYGILSNWTSFETIYKSLFAEPDYWVKHGMSKQSVNFTKTAQPNAEVKIYENNYHTTKTGAPEEIGRPYVGGFSGTITLSLHSLKHIKELDVKTQCPFLLVGFSYINNFNNGQLVYPIPIWGMLRDLRATGRKRPTWLSLELANKAIFDNMLQTTSNSEYWVQEPVNGIATQMNIDYIQCFVTEDLAKSKYGIILYNLDLTDERTTIINLPITFDPLNVELNSYILKSDSLTTMNEEAENIVIEDGSSNVFISSNSSLTAVMPKHSVMSIVLTHDQLPETPEVFPPNQPTGLSLTGGNSQVMISWNPNSEENIVGYNIYRSTNNSSFTPIVYLIQNTNYVDNNVVNGTTYYYQITAINSNNLESTPSNSVSTTPESVPELPPPTTPTNITTLSGNNLVTLSWNENTDENFAYYKVYRSTTINGTYISIANHLITPLYHDSNVINGLTYYYRVSSFNTENVESSFSNIAIGNPVPAIDNSPPQVPHSLNIGSGANSLFLTWSDNTTNLSYYNIYRSTDQNNNYVKIGTSNSKSYSDLSVQSNTTYYYKISSVNILMQESALSNSNGGSLAQNVVPFLSIFHKINDTNNLYIFNFNQ